MPMFTVSRPPESVSEEREIYPDDDDCHRHHIKRDRYLSPHFR
jgi:hypothetical protein